MNIDTDHLARCLVSYFVGTGAAYGLARDLVAVRQEFEAARKWDVREAALGSHDLASLLADGYEPFGSHEWQDQPWILLRKAVTP